MRKSYLIIGVSVAVLTLCICIILLSISFFVARSLSDTNNNPVDTTSNQVVIYESTSECSFATKSLCVDDGSTIYPTDENLAGRDILVKGTVTEVDSTALAFDGPLVISITADFGKKLEIHSPSGFDVCGFSQESRDTAFSLVDGDKVELLGNVNEDETITMCDATHYIKKQI